MIDTDKYEGHPPAPWGWRHKIAEYRLTANGDKDWIDIQVDEDTDPTVMTLIADAPLLLAEVKRHRPPKVDGKYMAWSDSHPKHDRRTWIEQVMEGVTDVGYWTWVNWQLQYGDEEE